ncbi:MAG: hypothetical protein P4L70_01560 [Parasulfuritortus sp.]|nr:hypothetical protein [Parasulfuritortus sp.]
MTLLKYVMVALLMPISVLSTSAWSDNTIVIVRHAEKPAMGLGQLTCQGLNRSLALAPVLLSRYGKPMAIYAPNPSVLKKDKGIPYAYVRPLATIEPLAIRSGLPVHVEYGMTQVNQLATALLAGPPGTRVVAWEHHWGETLARRLLARLNANPDVVPKWADSDFDSVYVIHIVDDPDGGRHPAFTHEQEGLNGLPDACADVPANLH